MLNVNIRVVTIVVTVLLSIFSEISISSYASITTTNNNAERHLMTQLALLNQTNNTTDIKKLKIALLTDALFSDAGYDLIIAQGFEWGGPSVFEGKDYPNTKFVVFTGLANSTNVASIFPMQQ